jgi:hypothetical protein
VRTYAVALAGFLTEPAAARWGHRPQPFKCVAPTIKKTMSNSAQSLPLSDNDINNASQETTSGGSEEVRWEIVARTAGLMPATIMAGRLQVEGIPTRTWQEGAGRALGLTVGILGTGYLAVPEEYVDKAQEILADESQVDWDEEE